MTIWTTKATPEQINERHKNTLCEHLEIEIIEVGDDYITASMPVDQRTKQPLGLLHGGASVALAESVGSLAANLAVEPGCYCVGQEINANHIKSVTKGLVYGTTKPLHLGRSSQVWEIKINNEDDQLVCISRLTIAVKKTGSH